MTDRTYNLIDPNTGSYIPVDMIDNGDGTYSPKLNVGVVTTSGVGTAGLTNVQLRASAVPVTMSGVLITAGESYIGQTGGTTLWTETTFQRPANVSGYIIGDMVSNSVTATTLMTLSGVVRNNGGTGYITKARFGTNQSTNVAQYRLWFYKVSNPTLVADNVPYTMLWANKSSRLGYIDMPAVATEMTGSDSSFAMTTPQLFAFTTASQDKNLYVAVETKTAFTPDSGQSFYLEVFTDVN